MCTKCRRNWAGPLKRQGKTGSMQEFCGDLEFNVTRRSLAYPLPPLPSVNPSFSSRMDVFFSVQKISKAQCYTPNYSVEEIKSHLIFKRLRLWWYAFAGPLRWRKTGCSLFDANWCWKMDQTTTAGKVRKTFFFQRCQFFKTAPSINQNNFW